MSFPKLETFPQTSPKESVMDMFAAVPEWLVWCAASGAGAVALALVVNTLEAALDLEA